MSSELSFDDLIEQRIAMDQEILARAKDELEKLENRRNKLLAILGSDWAKTITDEEETGKVIALPKYRDPETGKTWSGKGKRPRWFDADRADDFLIAA